MGQPASWLTVVTPRPTPGTVLSTLIAAARASHRVLVALRPGALDEGRERVFEGVPMAFRRNAAGQQQLVLRIAEDSEQLVLVERIVRVTQPG